MNKNHLSKRLFAVAEHIPAGAVIADIGTDHGILPIYAVKQGTAVSAIASDVNAGPLESARNNIAAEQLESRIITRAGDGLQALKKEDNVDTVIIAGMGGALITSMLNEGTCPLQNVQRLILQPNLGAEEIRRWLLHNHWQLTSESIIEESGKIYEILTAVKGNGDKPYSDNLKRIEAELLFGPFLLQKKNRAFVKKWSREKKQWETIISELNKAEEPRQVAAKKRELQKKINLAEEVLTYETS
ncbi:tRNA (adenine(22)-N(1))-methyltransferase [Salibacterium aidingense]|uniref:tRNA (adenine(22)-N(1))-methyltransferase n=1 Tax=Salibacterium aidingense TaxID=384933 RepID=UPI003BC9D337